MMWISEQLNKYRIKILNQFYGHIKVSIYIYVHLKLILRKSTEASRFFLKLLTLLISPFIFLTIWTLKAVKGIISVLIRTQEANYARMLDGTESIFLVLENNESRALITTLFLLEYNGSGNDFKKICQEEISKIISSDRFQKLRFTVARKCGYYYFKKSTSPLDMHFIQLQNTTSAKDNNNIDNNNEENKETEISLSLEELRETISDFANAPMPNNDQGLWEIRIGTQKIIMEKHPGKQVYPLIFRMHHVVGDAVTLFNMFSADFNKLKNIKSCEKLETEVLRPLDDTFTKSPFIAMSGLFDPPDDNHLCRTNGNKHFVWHTEAKPQMLDIVKQMKLKMCSSVTVVDVMVTCMLETLDQYLQNNNIKYPHFIYTVIPMMPPNVNFTSYGLDPNYDMSNKISLGFLKVPLKLDTQNMQMSPKDRLIKRLDLVKQEYDVFKNKSLDFILNRWQGKVLLSLLPHFLFVWLVQKYGISLMVSNIPGCQSMEFFENRLKVVDSIMFDPNTSISGISLMITSYEKRLSFAYTVDKATIENVQNVKEISTSFLTNLYKFKEIVDGIK